ncbi:MAG: ribosome maturation factor RimP [Acidimicrobiales bacterium]
MTDDLVSVLEPVIRAAHLELVDVELRSGVLLVTVDKEGGVDLDALTEATRAASVALDQADPIHGRYSLEVSSPGVERTLRTPAHFARAIGETVSVKTRPQVPGDRRLVGALVGADDRGFEIEVGDPEPDRRQLAYSDVDKVRTVFSWGTAPRPERGVQTKETRTRKRVANG